MASVWLVACSSVIDLEISLNSATLSDRMYRRLNGVGRQGSVLQLQVALRPQAELRAVAW